MIVLDGKSLAGLVKQEIKENIENNYIASNRDVPVLACILVGDDPASATYVNSKQKACALVGMGSRVIRLDGDVSPKVVKDTIISLNNDNSVSGILLQLPLPQRLRKYEDALINCIIPTKDVDSLTDVNMGKLVADKGDIAPCTPSGIMKIFEHYNISLDGKNVVVLGRSLLVGKSIALLCLKQNATVQICHSHTTDVSKKTKEADIIISAVGKPNTVTADMVKDGAVIIDVGINHIPCKESKNGTKIVGDVDYDNVKDKCVAITPVPGGVGPMTIAKLLQNTLVLHELYHNDTNINKDAKTSTLSLKNNIDNK